MQEMIGGEGIIVEIDETKFGKVKYQEVIVLKECGLFEGSKEPPKKDAFC